MPSQLEDPVFEKSPMGWPIGRCKIVLKNAPEDEAVLWVEETYEQVEALISQKEVFLKIHSLGSVAESRPQTIKVSEIVTYRPMED